MVQFQPKQWLLSEEELPETDNKPVDNELQIIIPALLRSILGLLWTDRADWYLGINLGVYYDPDQPAIGPDAFLSLGVQRFRPNGKLRLSYIIPRENGIVPQWVLEIVSQTPGGEYDDKMQKYAAIGVLYYTVYNPDYTLRDAHDAFEVYRLENGVYVRQIGNPVWMPEVGLGIGSEVRRHDGLTREWLHWYDSQSQRYATSEELRQQDRQQREIAEQLAQQERQRVETLMQRLQDLGLEP
jgi:Uma2 family endonuclease